jgi:hypothetical protein
MLDRFKLENTGQLPNKPEKQFNTFLIVNVKIGS